MQDKAQLVNRFNQAREGSRAVLAGIDTHLEIYPGWTIKEVLAHLAGWDDATIMALNAFVAHDPPPTPASIGLDAYNEQTVEQRHSLDYRQIVEVWELIREQLLKVLANVPEEMLTAKIVSPWGDLVTVEQLVNIMINHEREHSEIVKTRSANPQDPPGAH